MENQLKFVFEGKEKRRVCDDALKLTVWLAALNT